MTHETRILFLRRAAEALIAVGLTVTLGLFTPLAPLLDGFVDLAFAPLDGAEAVHEPAARLWAGIAGGLMAGWGATLRAVALRTVPNDPGALRAVVLPGALVWFAVDGLGSIAAGAPVNTALNLGFLALFAAPVLWPAPRAGRGAG